nr:putative ORF1 [Marmot picobirnavirus]
MTTNQIAYHNLLETQRTNKEKERETNRANIAKESEMFRSNRESERENRRSNMSNEQIKRDVNRLKSDELQEASRHNKMQEKIGISDSVAKHVSSVGSAFRGIGSLLS